MTGAAAVSPSGEDEPSSNGPTVESLRETFSMIDTDGSGSINASEFGTLLRLQGENVTDEDAEKILLQVDVDGDATNLTFDEFVEIMKGMQGDNKFDLASAFVARTKEKSSFLASKDPLYIRMQREREKLRKKGELEGEEGDIGLSNSRNARMALASIVDGNVAQAIVLVLIVVDVVCVILELLLIATKCHCLAVYDDDKTANAAYGYGSSYSSYGSGSSYSSYGGSSYSSSYSSSYGSSYGSSDGRRLRILDWMDEYLDMGDPDDWGDGFSLHRRLAGDGVSESCIKNIDGKKNNEGAYAYSGLFYSDEQYEWHHWLHYLSVGILMVFALQIISLFLIYCLEFFKEPLYILDAVVVFGAIYVETDERFTGGALFSILLSWRFLRIFHGLYTSFEVAHKQQHEKVNGERNKMLEMIVATRRKGAKKKMYFLEFHDKLHGYGVEEGNCDEHAAAAKKAKAEAEASGKESPGLEDSVVEMADDEIEEDHEELKRQLLMERERRAAAESMYVEIYEHLEEHMDSLKKHTDELNHGHGGHGEHSHADKMKTDQLKKQGTTATGLSRGGSAANLGTH